MVKHEALFGVQRDWPYFETGHGKVLCDDRKFAPKRPPDEVIQGGVAGILRLG